MPAVNSKTKNHDDSDHVGAISSIDNINDSQLRRKNGAPSTTDDVVSQTPKRQRVSQACEQCRAKKYKCDAIHPTCSACASSNELCSYRTSIKKRGLPTGYVRVLEMLWGAVFLEHSGSEAAVEALLIGEKRIFAKIEKDGVYAEVLLKRWRQSTISKAVDRYLGNEEITNDGRLGERRSNDQRSSLIEGENAGATNTRHPEAWIPYEWTSHNAAESAHARPAANKEEIMTQALPVFNSSRPNSGVQPEDHGVSDALDQELAHPATIEAHYQTLCLALPANAMQLINIYISYTHCWFPVIERDIFWKISFEYSGRTLKMSRNSPGSGKHAALWAILAYASFQDTARGLSTGVTGLEGVQLSTEQMYSNARGLIPSEDAEFEYGHVQALLLLVLVNIGLGNVTAAWLLIGQAVRRALDMGLGTLPINSSGYQSQEASSGSHKHIFSGCFALDTLVAARLGKRPHLRRVDAAEVGGFTADGQEEYEPWRDCFDLDRGRGGVATGVPHRLHTFSIFLQFIDLACILNDLLCDVPKGHKSEQYYQKMSTDLHRWVADLPSHCRLAASTNLNSQQGTHAVPQLLNLHLMYQSIVALLQLQFDHGFEETSIYNHVRAVYLDAANQSLDLLQQFSRSFGTSLMPPTFQYFITVVSHGMSLSGNQSDNELSPTMTVRRDLRQILSRLEGVWTGQRPRPTNSTIHTDDENRKVNGIQAIQGPITGSVTTNTQQQPDLGISLRAGNSKPYTFDQFAQPIDYMQVSGARSNNLLKNVPTAETQGFFQSPQARTEPFPTSAQNQRSLETYSREPPSTSPTHPVEVTMTEYHNGSDTDTTQALSSSDRRTSNQPSPLPYAIRTTLVNHSSPYPNPRTFPPDFQTTEALFGSPFSMHHPTSDFGAAGNTDAFWDELACLDDGERYASCTSLAFMKNVSLY